MGQPRDYGISEEISLLKDTASRFYQDHYTDNQIHQLVASDYENFDKPQCHWRQEHWQNMVELGWSMVAVPEEFGGMGMPLVAACLLAEETGRYACPSPLVETLKSTYLLNACLEENKDSVGAKALLDSILEGQALGLALCGPDGLLDTLASEVKEKQGSLTGTSYFAQDALKVDNFIVKAQTDKGVRLYKVNKQASGLNIIPDVTFDLSHDQAHLIFEDVKVTEDDLVADEEVCAKALQDAALAIHIIVAADMVGSNEWMLQTTAEYAKTRVQFDRPIGFFQAVKHPIVNVMIANDEAKSLVYNAACAFDHEPHMIEQYAHMAKASACDATDLATSKSIQLHGGIGVTWECYVHVFVKRAIHNQLLYGDGSYHRAKVASLLLD